MPYKVLRKKFGKLYSAIVEKPAKVRYKRNKWIKAPEWLRNKGYHLTYFDSLEDAIFFRNPGYCDRFIYFCKIQDEIEELPPIRNIVDYSYPSPFMQWPRGTKMAEKIMILKEIKEGDKKCFGEA